MLTSPRVSRSFLLGGVVVGIDGCTVVEKGPDETNLFEAY